MSSTRSAALLAIVVLAWSVAFGCTKSPTQFVVSVDSDLTVPGEMTRVVARVQWGDQSTPVEQVFPLRADLLGGAGDRFALPFSFGVGPGPSLDGAVSIELRAENARGELQVARRVRTRFVPEQSLGLPMFLARSCRGQACPNAETCTERGCISELVDPATLEEVEPGDELIGLGRDGGIGDAGSVGSDASDASGPRDVGPREDGGPDAGPDAGVACAPPAQDGDDCGPDGFRCCGGRCADTRGDESACGPGCALCPSNQSCIDGGCRACAGSGDCTPDVLICTDAPVCDEGVCTEALFATWCLIDGQCHRAGDRNPTDACLVCDPAESASAWSIAVGASCDDGLYCTATDLCSPSGTCVGSGQPCPTNAPSCLSYECDEDGDTCKEEIASGSCFIDQTCLNQGRPHPTNACLACLSGQDQRAWSPNTGGSCDDGNYCTATDICDGQGQCVGSGSPCPTLPNCAMSICNPADRTCLTMVNPNFCLIGGGCVPAGDSPVNQFCLVCNPGANPFDFTPRPNNVVCGVNSLCCGGVCTGANDGACGSCTAVCPGQCFCGGQGDPFSCSCN